MNRSVDSCSDLYALGIALYQMRTGALSFNASDLDGVGPPPYHQEAGATGRAAEKCPSAVSQIVMKLLAKMSAAEKKVATLSPAATGNNAESDVVNSVGMSATCAMTALGQGLSRMVGARRSAVRQFADAV